MNSIGSDEERDLIGETCDIVRVGLVEIQQLLRSRHEVRRER